jgi:hypothetical protein
MWLLFVFLLFFLVTHADVDMEEPCRDPEEELFIYCILLLKYEMAKVFWREGFVCIVCLPIKAYKRLEILKIFSKNSVFLTIIASKIFKSYAIEFEEDEEELLAMAKLLVVLL